MKHNITRKSILVLLILALLLGTFAGCAKEEKTSEPAEVSADDLFAEKTELDVTEILDEAPILAEGPAAVSNQENLRAPGTSVKKCTDAIIDYSNIADGYVMCKFITKTDKRIKVQVKGPTTTYTYNLPSQEWAAFPLSDGNGSYKVTVFKNVKDNSYATVISQTFTVKLTDEFAPFLQSNQYVNYENATNTKALAVELLAGKESNLEKVAAAYDYVVKSLTYDKEKAKTVQSGYLPVLDDVLEAKKGICFDYAALMTGMLRSQGVPCKLVVGYAGKAYHAWISVYSDGGWVNGVVYFDGTAWQRMDPTFASSAKQSSDIMKYIGDGNNYTAKYFY